MLDQLLPIVAVLAVFAFAIAVKTVLSKPSGGGHAGREKPTVLLPYERLDAMLTPTELAYFRHLQAACRGRPVLLVCKVRLADLVAVKTGAQGRQGAWNRIQAKHVDFVLCDAASNQPLLAIELDDASHGRASRQKRDDFVDRCLDCRSGSERQKRT